MNDAVIRLENVSKEYRLSGGVIRAVDNLTWRLEERAKLVAVVGPSGSGKTTLLNLIGTLDRATEGNVYVAGVNVADLSEKELVAFRRKKLGFIFQTFNLVPNLTAQENVMLPLEFAGQDGRSARSRAEAVLEQLGLAHRGRHRASRLSGGEQQRVAIARALASDPEIILADEPTGNLDKETGAQIIGILKRLAHERQKTVIVVTHDEKMVDLADAKYRMEDGRLAAYA